MSQGEALRYRELKGLQQMGFIHDLSLQVVFPIAINNEHICNYIADFTYTENKKYIVEDFKGYRTNIYRLKKKLFEAAYQQKIRETGCVDLKARFRRRRK